MPRYSYNIKAINPVQELYAIFLLKQLLAWEKSVGENLALGM